MSGTVFSLCQTLRERALHKPAEKAFVYLANGVDISSQITWGELDKQAQAFALRLVAHGVKPNENVLLVYPSGLEFLVAFMGCMYAGVVAVPSSIPYREHTASRLVNIVVDARVAVACTTRVVFEQINSLLAEHTELSRIQWLIHEDIDTLAVGVWKEPVFHGDSLCFLQYTSGSTSVPKGVMITHLNLLRTIEDIRKGLGFGPDSVVVTWLPVFHDLGLIYSLLTPLYVGGRCYIMSPVTFLKRPFNWLLAITKYKGTHTAAPNFAYELCCRKIEEEEKEKLDLSTVVAFINAAEPIRLETVQKFWESFRDCGLSPIAQKGGYGLAEATVKVSAQRLDEGIRYVCLDASAMEQNRVQLVSHDASKHYDVISVGVSEIGADIRIVNPKTKRPCAEDEIGEIWVRSDSIAVGYWNRPKETAETFRAYLENGEGPYLRTGDMGFLLDGDLFIAGRIKDMIIVQGRNFYPQDIEYTVEKCHFALRPGCGAAFAIRDRGGDERLVIVQEVRQEFCQERDLKDVINAIRMAVAKNHGVRAYAVALILPRTIPKTTSGKIRRSATRQAFLVGGLKVVAYWQAPTK